jgi:ABC-2 type transport system ATP-binding protein
MSEKPIIVDSITKVYGDIVAVDHISFEVQWGTVLALLGPNGAGKTTLIKILTTIARPTSGTGLVDGHDVCNERKKIRSLIGVVPQANNFDRFLTVRENLVLHAKMHGMPGVAYNPQIDQLLRIMGLDQRQNDKPDELSGGMQRRLVIARALVHDPKILFLDEPTTGLDPQSRRAVWDYVGELRHRTTIMLTTHYMDEADQLSDRIIIMDRGKTLRDGTAAELKRGLDGARVYEIEVQRDAARYKEIIDALPAVKVCHLNGSRLEVSLKEGASLRDLVCLFEDGDITQINTRQPTLEDVFLNLTGHELRD